MEKPNFERIAEVMAIGLANSPEEIPSTKNAWANYFNGKWELNSKANFFPTDKLQLRDLLKEYKLEAFHDDFRFIGDEIYIQWIFSSIEYRNKKNGKNPYDWELIKALKIFQDNEKGISINIIRKQKVISSIQNPELINIMQKSLYKYFEDLVFNSITEIKPTNNQEWEKLLESKYSEGKAKSSQKGRRRDEKKIYRFVFYLWKYLQVYTEIKAIPTATYSKEQAKFIFDFLVIYNLIDSENIQSQEDSIANYLNSYFRTKMKEGFAIEMLKN